MLLTTCKCTLSSNTDYLRLEEPPTVGRHHRRAYFLAGIQRRARLHGPYVIADDLRPLCITSASSARYILRQHRSAKPPSLWQLN